MPKSTKTMNRSALAVPLEDGARTPTHPLMEDTRMPTVRPDAGTASYKKDFPWMQKPSK